MKVSFDNQSLTITSKKFNPFNFSIYGMNVKTEKKESQVDPFGMLENLTAAKKLGEDATAADNVSILRSVLKK